MQSPGPVLGLAILVSAVKASVAGDSVIIRRFAPEQTIIKKDSNWSLNQARVGLSCVSAPEAINYIHVIFNLYNQLNKFVALET